MNMMTDSQDGAGRPVAHVDRTLESLIPRFIERRLDDADTIEALVAEGDFERIQAMAHAIKGSGGGYGFDPVTDFGVEIEAAAKECDGASVIAGARAMREYLGKVEVVFVDE